MRSRWKWFLTGTAGLFTADQVLKTYVEQKLDKKEEKKLKGPLVLRRVDNPGVCLGMLADKPALVRGLSAAAAGAITVLQTAAIMKKEGFWRKTGLSLLSAGAWSNTFDRFARGHVVDYIGFKLKEPGLAKITYNLGDFFIAAGALLLSVGSLLPMPGRKDGTRLSETGSRGDFRT